METQNCNVVEYHPHENNYHQKDVRNAREDVEKGKLLYTIGKGVLSTAILENTMEGQSAETNECYHVYLKIKYQ